MTDTRLYRLACARFSRVEAADWIRAAKERGRVYDYFYDRCAEGWSLKQACILFDQGVPGFACAQLLNYVKDTVFQES